MSKPFITILTPDGQENLVPRECLPVMAGRVALPEHLRNMLGLEGNDWSLAAFEPDRLCAVQRVSAGAPPKDPRRERLEFEYSQLSRVNNLSDHVRVEPLNARPGSFPDHYRFTYLCRGIIGINRDKTPVFGDRHQVEVRCGDRFPRELPLRRWITPIWHPNIQHNEPKDVCVNASDWAGGMRMEGLCRLMFQMVQYQNYHADDSWPFPFDGEVAEWVKTFAEPNGIVAKNKPVDNRVFYRPTSIRIEPDPDAPIMRVGAARSAQAEAPSVSRVKFG